MFLHAEFILPPSVGGLVLLKYLGLLTFFIHLPFILMLLGCSILSLMMNLIHRENPQPQFLRFSREIMEKGVFSKGLEILLGVIPLLTLTLLFQQMLYGNQVACILDWWFPLVLQIFGFIFLHLYRSSFEKKDKTFLHLSFGAAGIGSLLFAYFLFIANKSYLLYPESWAIESHPMLLSFASNILPTFFSFLSMCLLVSGAGILLYSCFTKDGETLGYVSFVKKVGILTALAGSILYPAPLLLDLVVLPESAVSSTILALYIVGLLIAMIICLSLFFALVFPNTRWDKFAIFMILLSFCIYLAYDHTTRANTFKEQLLFLHDKALTMAPHWKEKPKREKKDGMAADTQAGKKIFEDICSSCHTIDGSKGLGPSFKALYGKKHIVLVGGQEKEVEVNEEYLRNSILNPSAAIVKGFNDLMTNQNLSERQIDDVVEFIKSLEEKGKK